MGVRMGGFHSNRPLKVLTSLRKSRVFVVCVLSFVEAS